MDAAWGGEKTPMQVIDELRDQLAAAKARERELVEAIDILLERNRDHLLSRCNAVLASERRPDIFERLRLWWERDPWKNPHRPTGRPPNMRE